LEACAEALRLLRGDSPVSPEPAGGRVPAWVDAGDRAALAAGLAEAVSSGSAVRLESARGLLIGGTGVAERAAGLTEAEAPGPRYRQTPLPGKQGTQ
jgi:hypothetical protein